MNEKIKQLAEQSDIFIDKSNCAVTGNNTEIIGWHIEEFAHKIVEETINELCQQMWSLGIDFSNYPGIYSAFNATEKQFGFLR